MVQSLRAAGVRVVIDVGASELKLLSSSEVAALFSVSARWVREHKAELGAVHLPGGDLRFRAAAVKQAID